MSELKTNKISTNDQNNVAIDNALGLKSYTTAGRDALTSVAGDMIYNTTTTKVEYYDGTDWNSTGIGFLADTVIVGGGAGGIAGVGGGGGGGGVVQYTNLTFLKNVSYYTTIGAGGVQTNGNVFSGHIGTSSQFVSIAGGGGYGGGQNADATQPPTHTGSGGGVGGGTNAPSNQTAGSAGSSGDANSGGTGVHNGSGGGGGGAGAAGTNASGTTAGNGGVGYTSSITGTSEVYGSGGGGGTSSTSSGSVGTGGTNAGDGGYNAGTNNAAGTEGHPGTINTGSGGGGSGGSLAPNFYYGYGGAGGSGIVIIRYATADVASYSQTGLTITETTDGSDTVLEITQGTGNITFS